MPNCFFQLVENAEGRQDNTFLTFAKLVIENGQGSQPKRQAARAFSLLKNGGRRLDFLERVCPRAL